MTTRMLIAIGLCLVTTVAAEAAETPTDLRYFNPDDRTGSSRAVMVNDVPLVHTTQLLPFDSKGEIAGAGQVGLQAAIVLDHIATALAEAMSGLDRLAKLNVYVTDAGAVEAVQQVLAERLPRASRPPVAFVVTRLSHPDALLAMDAVATTALDPGRAVKIVRSAKLCDTGTNHLTVMPPGTRIYVSGQAEKGATLGEATRRTLESLRATLKYLGVRATDVVQLKAFRKPMADVADGTLQAVGGPGAMEYHARPLGDLVLQLDVRTRVRHTNGGLFFRSIPGDFMNGYEAQIYNRGENGNPGRPAHYSSGAIDDRQSARRLVSRDHQFFKMTVIAHGPHIATWVNGCQLTDWTDTRPVHDNPRQGLRTKSGTIQLQAHDPGSDLEFKNIWIAELSDE